MGEFQTVAFLPSKTPALARIIGEIHIAANNLFFTTASFIIL